MFVYLFRLQAIQNHTFIRLLWPAVWVGCEADHERSCVRVPPEAGRNPGFQSSPITLERPSNRRKSSPFWGKICFKLKYEYVLACMWLTQAQARTHAHACTHTHAHTHTHTHNVACIVRNQQDFMSLLPCLCIEIHVCCFEVKYVTDILLRSHEVFFLVLVDHQTLIV
jgi:hypothetical protein